MISKFKLASEKLSALPKWLKGVIALQSVLPAVVMVYQLKFMAGGAPVMAQQIDLMASLQASAVPPNKIVSLLQATADAQVSFHPLVYLNLLLVALGFAVLAMMFPSKPKALTGSPTPVASA